MIELEIGTRLEAVCGGFILLAAFLGLVWGLTRG